MTTRGTVETRPGEPGASGRAGSSLLEKMQAVVGPAEQRFGTPEARVLSAQLVGTNVRGQRVYKVAVRHAHGVQYMTQAWTGKTFTSVGKLQGTPARLARIESGDPLRRSVSDEELAGAQLDRAKEQWHMTINGLTASTFHKRNLTRAVDNYQGSAEGLNQKMAEIVKAMAPIDAVAEPVGGQEDPFDPFAGLLDAIGDGGGGFTGPEYVSPDRRVVEDFVTGALVGLIGSVPDDGMVNQFADLYMADHRRNFDNPEQEIDPSQSVKEAIRETEHYQQIHQLRPESEDERAWVAQRREAAAQGGLDTGRQEDFAVTQATVGGDLPDVQRAASVAQLQQSGSMRGTQLQDQLRGVTQAMFQGVVR